MARLVPFTTLALGLALAATSIVAAAPPEASGEWSIAGDHSKKGAYTGKLVAGKVGADGTCSLSAELVLASGEKLAWSARGRVKGGRLRATFALKTVGIVGTLEDGAIVASSCKGSWKLSADGKTLKGGWNDGTDHADETCTRVVAPVAAGKLLALVRPDGKEAPEECLAPALGAAGNRLSLLVKKTAGAPEDAKVVLEHGSRVALYRQGSRLPSGSSLPNADATLEVEGLSPSDPGVGETIGARLVASGSPLSEDKVTAHVARCAFHLAGHGAGGAYQVESWLSSARRDKRTNPTLVEGKDEKTKKRAFYAVWVCQDERSAKLALACENAVISYDGHSNFGMGFAFETGFTSIKQFLNIADPQVPVNWQYLREHQEHPGLMIDDSEYADDAATPKFSDPVQVGKTVHGKLGQYDTSRYPESGGSGTRLGLTRGPKGQKWLDHHYGDSDNWRIVIKAGSSDMPVKKWSRIYLHSCYSGQYYSDSFGGKGTLFFTNDEAHAWSTALPAFLRSCIEGKSDDEILKAVNAEENLNDYIRFD